MARVKIIFTIALIIALVLSYEISSTEGRLLKIQENSVMSTGDFNFHRRNPLVDTEGDSDDFRPTDPGHSPGAGHPKGPSSAAP
ncbi:hypothetical protein P3X46_020977 [Hevea brasiliensis]|uniref:Uncharacterized protein n=1 Tax=Hevea brasiliensis TaxID=3981 RepID=A0ABQ9LGU3_HEVBR|nr:hypothetical protein P3X46_020977 [Hevea brasiliensis]